MLSHSSIFLLSLSLIPSSTQAYQYHQTYIHTVGTGMAGFKYFCPFFLRPYHNHPFPQRVADSLASTNSRVIQNAIFCTKVLDALAPNNTALVLRRTGWISVVGRVVVKMIVFCLCESHLSHVTCALNGGGHAVRADILCHRTG